MKDFSEDLKYDLWNGNYQYKILLMLGWDVLISQPAYELDRYIEHHIVRIVHQSTIQTFSLTVGYIHLLYTGNIT